MTKNNVVIFILFIILFAGLIFWYLRGNICERGVSFYIGTISEEYDVTEKDLVSIVDDAADVWEDAVGYSVFSFEEDGDVRVNLLFDERQEKTINEHNDRFHLESSQDSIEQQTNSLERDQGYITELQQEFRSLESEYNAARSSLNSLRGNPNAYNSQVQKVNSLASELNNKQAQLNSLVNSYNARIQDTTSRIDSFNNTVNEYNESYAGDQESFDKGDYGGGILNLYQYEDRNDLVLLVVHELGHALGIGHVQNSLSVMHYRLEDQNTRNITLTEQDKIALNAECTL